MYHSQRNYGETESKTNKIVWHKLRIFIFFFIDFFFSFRRRFNNSKEQKVLSYAFPQFNQLPIICTNNTNKIRRKKIHIVRIIFFYRKTHIEQTDESKKKFFYTNQHQFFLKKNFIDKLIKPVYNDWGEGSQSKITYKGNNHN